MSSPKPASSTLGNGIKEYPKENFQNDGEITYLFKTGAYHPLAVLVKEVLQVAVGMRRGLKARQMLFKVIRSPVTLTGNPRMTFRNYTLILLQSRKKKPLNRRTLNYLISLQKLKPVLFLKKRNQLLKVLLIFVMKRKLSQKY